MVQFLLAAFLFPVSAQKPNLTDSLSQRLLENILNKALENKDSVAPEKRSSLNAYPYIFYTPESQLAFGAGGIYIFYFDKSKELKPSKIGFGGYYSTNKQYNVSLNPELYLFRNKLYIETPVSFGYFINKFWGAGDQTVEYENASYSQETFSAVANIQVPPRLFSADRTGIIVDYDYTNVVDKMGNEFLESDSVRGKNGGQVLGVGGDLVWDSRDNIFFPNTGGYQYFKIVFYPGIGDHVYSMLELDVRTFASISPDHVFAFNLFVQSATGDVPFYKLPSLGGQNRMRGYFSGRYRDNFYGMVQAEYRQYIWKRLGVVAFAGVGNVSETIIDYNFSTLKYSGGIGFRFLFNKEQKVNLRMDIGFGNDGNSGIYFGIQEAF